MSPVALILGAGARIGQSVAEKFLQAGYKVALASRTPKESTESFKHFTIDLASPEAVPALFQQVKQQLGAPSVVIYNAAGSKSAYVTGPFTIPLDSFNADLAVSVTSAFYAAEESVKGWDELHANGTLGKEGATFIYTGNFFNVHPNPSMLAFGIAKSGGGNMIQGLAEGETSSSPGIKGAYPNKPYKFYYGDQRNADGSPKYTGLSGPAHAQHYFSLAQEAKQEIWAQTFVEGKGYVKFD